MPIFEDLFRPKGVSKIVFTDEPTQVKFKWGMQEAIIYLNQKEFVKLSPSVRYFVIMHEVGHLHTMRIFKKRLHILASINFSTNATAEDELNADYYALEACLKVGINFKSISEARTQYDTEINQ